jgi:hypothetical protein
VGCPVVAESVDRPAVPSGRGVGGKYHGRRWSWSLSAREQEGVRSSHQGYSSELRG